MSVVANHSRHARPCFDVVGRTEEGFEKGIIHCNLNLHLSLSLCLLVHSTRIFLIVFAGAALVYVFDLFSLSLHRPAALITTAAKAYQSWYRIHREGCSNKYCVSF